LPKAGKHRHVHVLFPFVTKDDYDGYDRDEFLMNTEYVSFASSVNARKAAPYNIALLFVWTGTKKMSIKVSKTIKDCETYLNATPPVSRTSRDPLLSAGAAAVINFLEAKHRACSRCGVPLRAGADGYHAGPACVHDRVWEQQFKPRAHTGVRRTSTKTRSFDTTNVHTFCPRFLLFYSFPQIPWYGTVQKKEWQTAYWDLVKEHLLDL